MIKLPEAFLVRMKNLLSAEEFAAFCTSYEQPTVRGLRVNLLKTETAGALSSKNSVPWCKAGYYYSEDERPGKSVAYHAGLFYIQEPSAMCPAEALGVERGHRVLDICAAPGGKSVQIAGHLQGEGLLVSNDSSASRCRALVKNLERAGVTNAVVLTEQPKKLAERFPEFFDRILVDAPCSGEGMFRRDTDAVKAYEKSPPEVYTPVQAEILHHAAKMLRSGGRMVYSTCTFNTQENEEIIAEFLKTQSDFSLVEIDRHMLGVQKGRGKLTQTARIWPHLAQGEGHFIALMEHNSCCFSGCDTTIKSAEDSGFTDFDNAPDEFLEFQKEFLNAGLQKGAFVSHGANLYLQPLPLGLRGLRVARSGWLLGECVKGRFIPSQALAMGIRKEQARFSVELSQADASKYLYGESLHLAELRPSAEIKPWVLVCHNSHPLGWARFVSGRLKNNLPVGWVVR